MQGILPEVRMLWKRLLEWEKFSTKTVSKDKWRISKGSVRLLVAKSGCVLVTGTQGNNHSIFFV